MKNLQPEWGRNANDGAQVTQEEDIAMGWWENYFKEMDWSTKWNEEQDLVESTRDTLDAFGCFLGDQIQIITSAYV
jgi:hypothetical protein